MPSFPCDNADDFIPDEMYDSVRHEMRELQKKLGRSLTEEEIAEIYNDEGLEPPREVYRNGRTYVDYGFDMEELEEEAVAKANTDEAPIDETKEQAVAPITTQQNSENELTDIETLSPRMAEYWKGCQTIAQEFGAIATLVPQNKDHSTTPKTRFVFLAGKPQTDYEQNSTKQE
jgi:hypothetical protein